MVKQAKHFRHSSKKIGVLWDTLLGLPGKRGQSRVYRPEQAEATLQAVQTALRELGYQVQLVPVSENLLADLTRSDLDLVFNLAAGACSRSWQAHVVAQLEMSQVPFTGSGLTTHVLALNKHVAKQIFRAVGVPTPASQVLGIVTTPVSNLPFGLSFPVIVKPVSEGSSIGIWSDSVVTNLKELRAAVRRLTDQLDEPVLIEEYIEGREFTVGILGNDRLTCLPVEEIIFPSGFYDYQVKKKDAVDTVCPAEIPPGLAQSIQEMCRKVYRVMGCRGYARFDLRLDRENRPYLLEVNTLPGLQPGYSELPRMAAAAGMSFRELVGTIVTLGFEYFAKVKARSLSKKAAGMKPEGASLPGSLTPDPRWLLSAKGKGRPGRQV